jgi:hypothetical protein
MASPPPARDAALIANGARLLLVGAVLAAIGIALMIPLEGTAAGIGVALASLGVVPTLAGVGMLLSGLVSRRARSGRPFA